MAYSGIEQIKRHIFAQPMPDMPPVLREVWQVAFMFRRKYSDPSNKDPETYFASAWSDMKFIAETYGNNETVQSLLSEVYLDIERQYKVVRDREAAT